jgi:hypothetical protein
MDAGGHPGPDARRDRLREFQRDTLRALGSGTMPVSNETHSMAPLLWGGERIAWRRLEGRPRFGELLVVLQKPGPVVHRVVLALRPWAVRTKGDARPAADLVPVRADEILGVVVAVERRGAVFSLDGDGPRRFARRAARLSAAGHLVYRLAALSEGAARRLGLGVVLRARPMRRVYAWQRRVQRRHFLVAFEACHPSLPALPFAAPERDDDPAE